MSKVFISYAREDQAFVRRLHAGLRAAGWEPWVDWESIPPTAQWMAEVRQAIVEAEGFLFVVSPASVQSKVCAEELGIALETNTRLVPLLREDVAQELLPEAVAAHNWIPFRQDDDFEVSFARLVQALETDLDWVRTHTRLEVRASEWDRRGRDRSFLLRGSDLEEAERNLAAAAEKAPAPTQLQTEYVYAGRRAAGRRQRFTVGAVSAGLVIALVLAAFALVQRGQAIREREAARAAQTEAERAQAEADARRREAQEQRDLAEQRAREAKSGELAAESINQLQADPELALLLARAAGHLARTPQAEDALRQVLQRSNVAAVLRGHSDQVVRAAFSPDGTAVATASWDDTARVWNSSMGTTTVTLSAGDDVYDVAYSPDGSLVATAGGVFSSDVHVWDPTTGTRVATIPQPDTAMSVDFSPDGTRVATVAGVWEARTGRPVSTFEVGVASHHLATFSPDGRLVAVAPHFVVSGARHILSSTSGRVGIFEAATGRLVAALPPDPALSARFRPDGRRIAVTSGHAVTVWTVPGGRPVATLRAGSAFPLDARWSPDGRMLVTAEEGAVSRVWDVAAERVTATLRGHGGAILVSAFSPDGRLVVTAGVDQTARVWSVATGRPVFVLRGHTDWVFDARFSPDSASVLTASGDGTARVWDVRSPPGGLTLSAGAGPVHPAVFTPDGRLLVTGTGQEDSSLRVWDALTGHLEQTLCCQLGPQRLAMAPKGDIVAAALGRMEIFARAWDLETGDLVFEHGPGGGDPFGYMNDVAFDADGRLLLAGPNATATLWDPRTNRLVRTLGPGPGEFPDLISAQPGPGGMVVTQGFEAEDRGICLVDPPDACGAVVRVYGAAGSLPEREFRTNLPEAGYLQGEARFSPDGRWIVATGAELAALLDAETGEQMALLEHPVPPGEEFEFLAGVQAVFSPDGSVLATAAGPTARLWSVPDGELLATLSGHTGYVSRIVFSPDGRLLVSASHDRTARVWTMPGGELAAVVRGQGGALNDAAFSPDGRLLVTTSEDGTARVWPIETFLPYADLVELAEARVTREFTPEERAQYLGPFESEVPA